MKFGDFDELKFLIEIFGIIEEKKNKENPNAYLQSISSLKFLSHDYFTQNLINRVLFTKIPAVDLHDCELHDNTFFYLLLRMLDQKEQKVSLSTFSKAPTGVSPFLTHLDVSRNNLTVLPPEIKHLSKLQWLNVSNNHLKSLPITLGLFPDLKVLDISNNELKSLPSSFAELRNHKTNQITLAKLSLAGNDIEVPPKRIVKQGIEAIIDYFTEQLDGADETCTDISVLFLGNTASGRTSLLSELSSQSKKTRKSKLAKVTSATFSKEYTHDNTAVEIVNFQLKGIVTRAISDAGANPLDIAKDILRKTTKNSGSIPVLEKTIETIWNRWKTNGIFYEFSKQLQARAYSRYFIANEFVEWMITNPEVPSRKLAIQIGALFEEAGLIRQPEKNTEKFSNNREPFIICTEEASHIVIKYQALDFSRTGT